MCGIAGYISLNNTVTPAKIKRACLLLQHRGPDAEGFYFSKDERVGLAHRRLSVLDLSAAANQPMFSANGRYCIVFNGEVYNYKQLAQLLACKGASLKTASDTEVILELFVQLGPSCFSRMNGMFAIAIFDLQEKILTLCRDQLGIKPLFFYQDEQTILFGSELKVIKNVLGDSLEINRDAIPCFLHLGFIPQPLTIYLNTIKFPAGHYLQVSTEEKYFAPSPDMIPYWETAKCITPSKFGNGPVAKKQLNELLLAAVQRQLVSDVPIGTFLSGGVDSSLVTALASKIASGTPVKTFSIGVDEGKYNESAYALNVAKQLGTDHHPFVVKEYEVINLVDKLLPAYDEPFADTSAFPTMMVSSLAKQHVTVTLSGDGGDELFHGYGMYQWAERLASPLVQMAQSPIYRASRLMSTRYERIGNMFACCNQQNIVSHIFSQEQYYFMESELDTLLTDPFHDFSSINKSIETDRELSPREKQSLWDMDHYLKDDLLVKVDRASMLYSLEVRVPFLDIDVVEFAVNLDEKLKIRNGKMKYLLKEVLYDYLPKQIFDRPKQGFSIPLAKWLKTDLKYLLDRYTSEEIICKYDVVQFPVVKEMKRRYLGGTDYLFNRLWLIIVLHWWLEENQSQNHQGDE